MIEELKARTVYSTPYLTISIREDGILHEKWHGNLNLEQMEEGLRFCFNYAAENGIDTCLCDHEDVTGLDSCLANGEQLAPDVMAALKLKVIAHVYSKEEKSIKWLSQMLEGPLPFENQAFSEMPEALNWLRGKTNDSETASPAAILNIKDGDDTISLDVDGIYFISRHDRKTIIQTRDKEYTIRKSLTDLLESLPSDKFMRVHKSYILNLNKIDSLQYNAGGYYRAYVENFGNTYIMVSKNRIQDLKSKLNFI